MTEIGQQLRALRRRTGLTQEELAERSSLSERSLRDLESGRVQKPRAKSIRLIASALELSDEETRQLLALIADTTPPPAVAKPQPTRLQQLPAADVHFTGRFAELRELDELVSDRPPARIVTITAIGGSGKTALAVHWAHGAAARFPDGQLYVDLHGFTPGQTPLDPAEALGRLLTALDIPPGDQPTAVEERAALFRSQIADRRLLLLLDNAATAEQVRPLLPGTPTCATIITSRERLAGLIVRDGARPLLLDAMTVSEAGELLRGIVGPAQVDGDRGAAGEIIELCSRLPLAIRVVGAGIALGDQRTLREAADALAAPDRLERLSLPDDPVASVLPAFQVSYDRLPADLKLLFGRLGLLPGTTFGPNVVASLMASDGPVTEGMLQRLVALNLVQPRGAGRFGLHDLVKLFAQRCSGPDEPALRRSLDYYLQAADAANHCLRPSRVRTSIDPPLDGVVTETFGSAEAAGQWCADELTNLANAVDLAISSGQYGFAAQLPTSMIDFFASRKVWPVWLATHQLGLVAADLLGDQEREGILRCGIGVAYRELREFELAQQYLEAAAAIAREGNHRLPLARALSTLGILAADRGQDELAVEYYAECARIAEEDGDEYGAMLALLNAGFLHLRSEHLDRARNAFEQVLPMGRRLQAAEVETACMGALAEILRLSGEPAQALDLFRESAALAERTNNPNGQISGHEAAARTLVQLGRIPEARSAYLSALQIAEDLGDPRRLDLQTALDQLAQAGP
ncbi:tetratricopeptide repeat protein [Kribbella sp. CA-293567]|uniref:tetratricopeptide repeat protein n=1 Tax=Kribbella sp. CA-293567 TaxID=3002436 RepID=UPI0022DDFAF1|nr:tetratricopeptide repeat protein [Kribbella sp. CA-293567]WBQ02672.1 tetratricopeptide repeat protein [Kribbella sp. CA-293567]